MDICLVCLRTDKQLKLNTRLAEFHSELCSLSLDISNILYCVECEYLLAKFYKFKQKCIQASEIFGNWMSETEGYTPPETLHTFLPLPALDVWIQNPKRIAYIKITHSIENSKPDHSAILGEVASKARKERRRREELRTEEKTDSKNVASKLPSNNNISKVDDGNSFQIENVSRNDGGSKKQPSVPDTHKQYTCRIMPLTPAQRQKKYREKLKRENPKKYEELKKKTAECALRYYKRKASRFTEEEKEVRRQKWREENKLSKTK